MNETVKPEVADRATPAPQTPPAPPAPESAPATQAPPKKRSLGGWIFLLIVIAAAGAYAWYRTHAPAAGPAESAGYGRSGQPPQTVRVATIATGDMPIVLDALGTVTPFETVTIKTQIAGKLETVGFEEGQMVKKGDFIAQIDPKPYQAALALAQAALAKDQALLAQAQSDLDRYETLNKQDSIAKQTVADQEALVAQDKAAIQSDQAQIQTAQINLDYTHIVSPITGRVGLRQVDPGNYLQPSDTTGIVVITELDPISVVFPVAEDDLPRIAARLKSGAALKTTAFDRANVNKLAEGTLTTYDSEVDTTTGTIKMRSTFANPEGALFPDQFVNVRLLIDTLKGAILAPNAAVQIGPAGSFVYVVTDDKVAKRDVTTGPANGQFTTISKGLEAGEAVVIDGVDRLRDGSRVTVAPSDAGGGGAAAPASGQGDDAASGSGQGGHHKHGQHWQGGSGASGASGEAPAKGSAP
jgi:multidrug efflux system membrane fusion protein